ncbi:Mu homology domain-containing protein [Schizophyllum amplum]|uniref:Mu homology domain-containing protein n=1 Tax=Schizophyllum amplum TaxID=97359 RepID=A0A550CUQ6_9AGAR|nr:Mu homology domain-containing protein [Auriculariopsis ampla]
MALDGLIILDNAGRPIIQSGFRGFSSAYPMVHIDAVNNAFAKASKSTDVDPVLSVDSYGTSDSSSACCHITTADIRVLCPVSGDVDTLFAFAFMKTFLEILYEYFGSVSAATMKDNFDVVYQLLEETLDAGGHPLTTSPNALRDIVLPPSLLTKLLNVAGANLTSTLNSGGSAAGGAFSSPIPWRKSGLRYNNNEIFFDVDEQLRAVVNKGGTALSSSVYGTMECTAKLSGTPDLILSFTNPNVLADCAFHPCVRLQRFARDRALSFVPPDGHFTLMQYRYAPGASASATPAASAVAALRENVPLPVSLKITVDLPQAANDTATFTLVLTSRLTTRDIENFVGEIDLGQSATAVKCTCSSGRSTVGSSLAGASHGASWMFDSRNHTLRWTIPRVAPAATYTIEGSFGSGTMQAPRPAHAVRTTFAIPTQTFSMLKVDQLKLTGEMYKPYKGVRGKSDCDIEWRW